jgi:1,4-dihydroxy-2-naphthoate octaprenyltransferase
MRFGKNGEPLVRPTEKERYQMIVLGVVLLILGWLLGVGILWTLGLILIVIGVILFILGSMGRPIGARRHYW